MRKTEQTKRALVNALNHLVQTSPTDKAIGDVRKMYPSVKGVNVEGLRDAAVEIQSVVTHMVEEAVKEFVQEKRGCLCHCPNSRCDVEEIWEMDLLAHWPDPELVETLGPNDTVPIGLCPECKSQIYMPESDTDESDSEDDIEWDKDCDCIDCRQERLYQELRKQGKSHHAAHDAALDAREHWERGKDWNPPHPKGSIEDNTGIPKQGSSDSTGPEGEYDPLFHP